MSPCSSQLLQHTPGSSPSLSLTHQIYSISQTCQVHFLHMSVHLATSTATTLMQTAFQCPPLRCCGPLPDSLLHSPCPQPPHNSQGASQRYKSAYGFSLPDTQSSLPSALQIRPCPLSASSQTTLVFAQRVPAFSLPRASALTLLPRLPFLSIFRGCSSGASGLSQSVTSPRLSFPSCLWP